MHKGKSHKRGQFPKVRRAAKRLEQSVILETLKEVVSGEKPEVSDG